MPVRYLLLLFPLALAAEEEPEYYVEEETGFIGFQSEEDYNRYVDHRLLIESEQPFNPAEYLTEPLDGQD